MLKHLKQLHGIRGLFPYLKTKRPTVLLIFFLSVIDAGLSLLPIQIIAAVVDLLSTGRSVFSPILGPASRCTLCSSALCTRRSMWSASHTVIRIPCCRPGSSNRCATTR